MKRLFTTALCVLPFLSGCTHKPLNNVDRIMTEHAAGMRDAVRASPAAKAAVLELVETIDELEHDLIIARLRK